MSRPSRRDRPDRRDRGVSDVVSFVLVFALMITAIGVVTTVGIGSLQDLRDDEQLDSAEAAFDRLGGSIDEVTQGGSPVRTGELDLQGGDIAVRTTGPTVRVRADGAWHNTTTAALRYRFGETTLAYESGTILRGREGARSVALGASPFVCRDSGAVVTVVSLRPRGPSSLASGTVRVTVRSNGTTVLAPANRSVRAGGPVHVGVDTQYPNAWTQAMTEAGWQTNSSLASRHDAGFTCPASRVFVRRTVVETRLIS